MYLHFQKEMQWLKNFAQAHSEASSWSNVLLPILDCALLNGHLCFLRMACIHMVAMVMARVSGSAQSAGAGCRASLGHLEPAFPASGAWNDTGSDSDRHIRGCQGISPPRFLLGGDNKVKILAKIKIMYLAM